MVVVHTLITSIQWTTQFKASLVYRLRPRTIRATQRNPKSSKTKQNSPKPRQKTKPPKSMKFVLVWPTNSWTRGPPGVWLIYPVTLQNEFSLCYQLQIAFWLGVDPCDLLVRQARTLQWHPQQMQKEIVTKMRDISCRGWQGCCHKTFLTPRKWSGFKVTLSLSNIFTTAHRQMNKSLSSDQARYFLTII